MSHQALRDRPRPPSWPMQNSCSDGRRGQARSKGSSPGYGRTAAYRSLARVMERREVYSKRKLTSIEA